MNKVVALRVLVERRREFRQGMLAAYVDLKKAFDSVHRESLWSFQQLRGISAGILGLLTGLYSGTESAVKCVGGGAQLLSRECGSEAGLRPCPIAFQYLHGLGTGQSCGPESLWSVYWQYQGH